MNLKDLIFGGGVKSGDDGGTYRDSIQAWLPIKNIIGGVVITKDGRFVKILELLPVNIYLKSPIEDFIIPFTCSPAMKQARGSFRSWLFRTTA